MSSSFIKLYSKVVIVAFLLSNTFNSLAQEKFGGLALYTVRDAMDANAKSTLQAVADAGYEYIEAASYVDGKFYNMTPKDFKVLLDDMGLIPISTHQGTVTLDNADAMIADVKAAGFIYFVIPVPPMGLFAYDPASSSMGMKGGAENLANILNTIGEKCKKAGLQLLYHNHNFEFQKDVSGEITYDYLLEHTNPEYVNFEMDLYWVNKVGVNPLSYFKKYPGRFKIWHIKDMDDQGRFAPVETGHIDFGKILKNKSLSGMKYYMVEQDMTFDGMTPLEAIKISHKGIKDFGFQ